MQVGEVWQNKLKYDGSPRFSRRHTLRWIVQKISRTHAWLVTEHNVGIRYMVELSWFETQGAYYGEANPEKMATLANAEWQGECGDGAQRRVMR